MKDEFKKNDKVEEEPPSFQSGFLAVESTSALI